MRTLQTYRQNESERIERALFSYDEHAGTMSVHYAFVSLEEDGSPAYALCAVLGPQIAEKRRDLGLTQKELAEKTGIDQAAISRIESGRANPTLNTLDALVRGVDHFLVVKMV